jgi:hypothetical protein
MVLICTRVSKKLCFLCSLYLRNAISVLVQCKTILHVFIFSLSEGYNKI